MINVVFLVLPGPQAKLNYISLGLLVVAEKPIRKLSRIKFHQSSREGSGRFRDKDNFQITKKAPRYFSNFLSNRESKTRRAELVIQTIKEKNTLSECSKNTIVDLLP